MVVFAIVAKISNDHDSYVFVIYLAQDSVMVILFVYSYYSLSLDMAKHYSERYRETKNFMLIYMMSEVMAICFFGVIDTVLLI